MKAEITASPDHMKGPERVILLQEWSARQKTKGVGLTFEKVAEGDSRQPRSSKKGTVKSRSKIKKAYVELSYTEEEEEEETGSSDSGGREGTVSEVESTQASQKRSRNSRADVDSNSEQPPATRQKYVRGVKQGRDKSQDMATRHAGAQFYFSLQPSVV
jgi:hypothetical protein